MTYEQIKNHPEVLAFLTRGNQNLGILGFTDHSAAHTALVAERAAYILRRMLMCRRAAEMLGCKFRLTVNGGKVL